MLHVAAEFVKVYLDKFNDDTHMRHITQHEAAIYMACLSKSMWHVVDRETTPTLTDARTKDEYVLAKSVALDRILLHMDANYHRVVVVFKEAW